MKKDDISFDNAKLSTLYFYELWWLANSLVRKADKLFLEAKVPEKGFSIQVNPELHSVIASILSDAANIKKLIITPDSLGRNEPRYQFKLRKERARRLKDALNSVVLVEILNHKVRNTLEHFDEYLDEANIALHSTTNHPPVAAYNMILSHWEAFDPRVYPVRLYISSEKTFYNMKWKVDIGKISEEAKDIIKKLEQVPELTQKESLAGIMLRLDLS